MASGKNYQNKRHNDYGCLTTIVTTMFVIPYTWEFFILSIFLFVTRLPHMTHSSHLDGARIILKLQDVGPEGERSLDLRVTAWNRDTQESCQTWISFCTNNKHFLICKATELWRLFVRAASGNCCD